MVDDNSRFVDPFILDRPPQRVVSLVPSVTESLFDRAHRLFLIEQLPEVEAVREQRIYFNDGSLITWHGTRIAKAIEELPTVFE